MPSTGMPSSRRSARSSGAPSEYTDAGPPDSTSAAGRGSFMRSKPVVCGSSSAKTPHSRIRRAISCEYWPPKSRTRTSSWAGSGAGARISPPTPEAAVARPSVIADGYRLGDDGAAVPAHPHRLLVLEPLALGLERRRDHHLGPLEVADVLVAGRRHRGAKGADQVEGAVVLVGRAEQDLLEAPVLLGRDPRPARKRWMKRRHPPVEAAAGSLGRAR